MGPLYRLFRRQPEALGERFGPLAHLPTLLGLGRGPRMGTGRPFPGFDGERSSPGTIEGHDIRSLSPEAELQARVCQGLRNREGPVVYLVQDEADEFWLEGLKGEQGVKVTRGEPDLAEKGLKRIGYDPGSLLQSHLALTLAGVHRGLPASGADEVDIDLRGLSREELLAQFRRVAGLTHPHLVSFSDNLVPPFADLVVRYRVLSSPLALSGGPSLLPVKRRSSAERRVVDDIFELKGAGCATFGYNVNPEIAGEYETINYLSRRGSFSIPTPRVANLSFFCALPRPTIAGGKGKGKGKEANENSQGPQNKVYLTFAFSDGDNINISYRRYDHFGQPHTTPVAWSLSPLLFDLAPNLLAQYREGLQPGDTLVAGPSGAGFTYPSRNPEMRAYLDHTKRYLEACGLDHLWVLDLPWRGYHPDIMARYAGICKGILAEFANRRPYRSSIELHGDTPAVFSSAFIQRGDMIAEIVRRRTPRVYPVCLFFTLSAWHISPEELDREVAKLGTGYEVVSLPRFFDLAATVVGTKQRR